MCILPTMYVCSRPGCPIDDDGTVRQPACRNIDFVSLTMLACDGREGA